MYSAPPKSARAFAEAFGGLCILLEGNHVVIFCAEATSLRRPPRFKFLSALICDVLGNVLPYGGQLRTLVNIRYDVWDLTSG
jgi:hypothetical protein